MNKIFIRKILPVILIISLLFSCTLVASAEQTQGVQNRIVQTKKLIGGTLTGSDELPESYKTPKLTSVKDQGSQGLCWAFAALGCVETFMLNTGLGEYDFSEEHPNWWALDDGEGFGWSGRVLGEGGWSEVPTGYLIAQHGPVNEIDVPYQNGGIGKPEKFDTAPIQANVTSVIYLKDDEETIKRAIMEYYSVSATYNSKSMYYSDDGSSYYSPKIQNAVDGHAVCVVGWDDNYSKNNFGNSINGVKPQNDGAWLIKNSWGSNYGDNGYIWISYEDAYLFDETYGTTYAITGVDMPDSNKTLYQAEKYGATYTFPVKEAHKLEVKECTFANVYEFNDEFKTLDKIIFYSDCIGAEYIAYYIPLDVNGKPNTDKNTWTALSNGEITYHGYVCDDIKDFALPSNKGAVGIYMKANESSHVAIGVDEWLSEGATGKMYFLPNAQKDVSFLIDENGCRDIMDLYSDAGDDIGGQIVIKLIVNNSTVTTDSDSEIDTDTSTDTTTESDTETDTNTDTEPDVIYGDVNGDNAINMEDVIYIQRVIALLINPNETYKLCADVNLDEIVNLVDVTIIQKHIAKLIDKLPV